MNVNATSDNGSKYTDAAYSNKGMSGIISGMDTEGVVKSMLSSIQTKIDRKTQEQTKLEWKQDAYRDVINKINTFQNKFFNLTSDTCIRSSTMFGSKSVKSSSEAISVSAESAAVLGNHSVSVARLATATTVQGSKVSGGAITLQGGFASTPEAKITVGDQELSVDLSGCADSDAIRDALNNALTAEGITSGSFSLTDGKLSYSGTESMKLSGNAYGLKKLGMAGSMTTKEEDGSFKLTGGTPAADAAAPDGKLTLTLDGVSKTFEIAAGGGIDAAFREKVSRAFGSGVTFTDDGDGNFSLGTGTGRSLTVDGDAAALELVGLKEAASTTVNTASSISSLGFRDGAKLDQESYAFKINGTEFNIAKTDSIADILNKINTSDAGVTMSYNSLNDTFALASKQTGDGFAITMEDTTGNFLDTIGLGAGDYTTTDGVNAQLTVDGVAVERSSNSFALDGLTMTLNSVTTEDVKIATTSNTDKIYDSISSFVDEYNTLIADLNTMIHEKDTGKNYAPLTDAQEDEMSEKEIEKWTEKAKGGLLRSDKDISSFLTNMRTALYSQYGESTLSKFGIDSSSNYKDYGKLSINEEKLRNALETNPEGVRNLFVGKDGLATKLNDICTDTASTSSGSPGALVQLAGVEGKASDTNNTLSLRINSIKDRITVLKSMYETRKDRYWNQFNSMETALSSLSSTNSYLTNMISGGL